MHIHIRRNWQGINKHTKHPTGVGSLPPMPQVKRKIPSSRRRTHPAELRGASAPDVWPIGTLRGLLL